MKALSHCCFHSPAESGAVSLLPKGSVAHEEVRHVDREKNDDHVGTKAVDAIQGFTQYHLTAPPPSALEVTSHPSLFA